MWGGTTQINAQALQGILRGQKLRSELGIPINAKVILSVGEVNKNKNHKVGIEALAKINDDSIYYVICGRGPLLDENKKLAKEISVGNRVLFVGYRTDVVDFYKMADLFLFPSYREGLPVAVMEAMASGLPVIATNIRGSRDLVCKERLLNPRNVNEFVYQLLRTRIITILRKFMNMI